MQGEYAIAYAPLGLTFLFWVLGNALFAGRWRGARMKPLFGGRFVFLMNRRAWAGIFLIALIWAVSASAYIRFFSESAAS